MKGDRTDEKQHRKKQLIQDRVQSQKPGGNEPKKCKNQSLSYMSMAEDNDNSLIIGDSNQAELQVPEEIIDYGEEKNKDSIKQQPLQNFPILRNEPFSQMEDKPKQVKVQLKDPKFQTEGMQIKNQEKLLGSSQKYKQGCPKNFINARLQHVPQMYRNQNPSQYPNPFPNPPRRQSEEESSESMAEVSQITQKMEEQFDEFQNISFENHAKKQLKFSNGIRSTFKQMYRMLYLTRGKVKQLNERLRKYQSRKQNDTKSEHLEKGIKKERKRRRASQIQRRYKCEFAKCQKAYGSSSSLSNHIHKKHKHEFLNKTKKDRKQARLLQSEVIDLSQRHDEEVDSFDRQPDNRYPKNYRFPRANRNDEIFEE